MQSPNGYGHYKSCYFMFCILFHFLFEEIVNKYAAEFVHIMCRNHISYVYKELTCKELHIEVSFIAVRIHKIDRILVCIIASHSIHNDDR